MDAILFSLDRFLSSSPLPLPFPPPPSPPSPFLPPLLEILPVPPFGLSISIGNHSDEPRIRRIFVPSKMNICRNNDESSNDPTVLVPLSLWPKLRPQISISELYYSTSSQADGIICRVVSFSNSPRREPPTFLRRLPPRFDLRLSPSPSSHPVAHYIAIHRARVSLSPHLVFQLIVCQIFGALRYHLALRENGRGLEPEGFANRHSEFLFIASFPFLSFPFALSTNFEIPDCGLRSR